MSNPASGNVISAVGITAVDSLGQCVEISVGLENSCIPVISNGNETSTSTYYNFGSISVVKHGRRVRVLVPNCENSNLIMLVSCREHNGQKMIKFEVTRGVNLRPTSHGLLGEVFKN